jgi:hypothetical protein
MMSQEAFGRWRAHQRARTIGPRLAELTGAPAGDSGSGFYSSSTASTELERIMNNPRHDYWHDTNPAAHKAAVDRVRELFRLTDGGR